MPYIMHVGSWWWWVTRVAAAAFTFLAEMGFFYVVKAPLTMAEAWPPALAGAIAIQLYVGVMEWRRGRTLGT